MNKRTFLIVGQFSLILGFIGFYLNYFYLDGNPILAFLTGVFFGLSLVMNVAFIVKKRKIYYQPSRLR